MVSAVWRFALSRRWWAGHVLIAVFCVLFLFLARWQWDRAHSITGSWQNLGYSLQWPMFAVFLVAAWARFLWLEQHVKLAGHEQAIAAREPVTAGHEPAAAGHEARPPASAPRVEDDPDDELAAYNAYLARLAAQDRQR
jgi:DNA-binding transcriptional regulator of glucitol operon